MVLQAYREVAGGAFKTKVVAPALNANLEPGNPGGFYCGCAAVDYYMSFSGQWEEGKNW